MSKIAINPFGKRFNLRNNEFITYCTEVRNFIEEAGAGAGALDCEKRFTPYVAALEAYGDAIVVVTASELTAKLAEADRERDNLLVGTMETIRNGERHYDPDRRTAAAALTPIVNAYTGIQERSIDDETGLVNNFIQDLREEKNTAYLAALGLDDWLTALETANNQCATLTVQRSNGITETGASKAARNALNTAYADLVELLNALAVVNDDNALYAEVFGKINNRIKHYEDVLANRAGMAAAANAGADTAADAGA